MPLLLMFSSEEPRDNSLRGLAMIPGDVSTCNSIPCLHPRVPSFESPNTAQGQGLDLTSPLTLKLLLPLYFPEQIFHVERFSVTRLSSNSSPTLLPLPYLIYLKSSVLGTDLSRILFLHWSLLISSLRSWMSSIRRL